MTLTCAISWIRPLRFAIVALWFAIDICGLLYGLKFFDETTTTFVAPENSDAYVATETMNEVLVTNARVQCVSTLCYSTFLPRLEYIGLLFILR